jgi:[ribosomal protein S5]-alanine N-acetyltransferase
MASSFELRSDRCIVRHYRADDAASLAQNGNDRRIWLNLRDRFPHPYTQETAEKYIAYLATQEDATSYAIEVAGEAVGGISLHAREDIERIGAEIGYWIGEPYWGRGIATSAIRLVTDYALADRDLHRVFAIPMTTNTGSCRALEKAGYVLEGTMRRNAIKDGRIFDSHLYARVRE